MFALEVILGDFGLATFSPIVISSVVATAVSRHFIGNVPAFIVPAYELVSAWELPLYVILGFFCAFVAVAFSRVLYLVEDFFDGLKFPEFLKATIGGLMLGILAIWFPHILGVGYGAIDLALAQKLSWWVMFFLIGCKIFATSVTIGSGGSGGIFAPSLFLGSMAGGFFGAIVHHILPAVTASPGAYSIVGMGAVVSGTTHGPLSAILILFEMTGDYKIILPLMIACIVTSLASRQLFKESIYTLKLSRRGVNIRAGREVNILKSIKVKDVMNAGVETIPENFSLGQIAERISKSKYNSFPVTDAEGNLTGILSFVDYRDHVFDENLKDLVVAKDLATFDLVTITQDDNLFNALEKITKEDFSLLPVVSPDNPSELLGVLTRRDIMGAYEKAVIKRTLLDESGQK
jgi:CIC family chloride channel protein